MLMAIACYVVAYLIACLCANTGRVRSWIALLLGSFMWAMVFAIVRNGA